MKLYILSGILFSSGLFLSSCNKSHDEPPLPEDEYKIHVTATIKENASRVSGADWTVGDVIGISSNKGHNNVPYSATTTAGEFDSATGISLVDNEELLLTAYYPYDPTNTGGTINFSVVDGNNTPKDASKIDFMYAPTAKATRHNPNVNFGFNHSMTKLIIIIQDGMGSIPAGATISYTLTGLATSGTFNTLTGAIVAGPKNGTVNNSTTVGARSSMVLPSHAIANTDPITISVRIQSGGVGDTYTGTITPALVAANEYTYTFSLSYGSTLNISSSTISGWNSVNGGNVNLNHTGQQDPPAPVSASIGDYLLKDGSILPQSQMTAADKSNIAGVVYYVGNDLSQGGFPKANGLALSLDDTDPDRFGSIPADFTESYKSLGEDNPNLVNGLVLEEMNVDREQISSAVSLLGYNNTAVIRNLKSVTDISDTLLEYLDDMTPVNGSAWYLPSFGEFIKINANFSVINTSLQKAGGTQLQRFPSNTPQPDEFYWTSTLYGQRNGWVYVFDSSVPLSALYLNRGATNKMGLFRFAVSF